MSGNGSAQEPAKDVLGARSPPSRETISPGADTDDRVVAVRGDAHGVLVLFDAQDYNQRPVRVGKIWSRNTETGAPECVPMANAHTWRHQEVRVRSFEDLVALLRRMSRDPRACMVRGALRHDVRTLWRVRRRLHKPGSAKKRSDPIAPHPDGRIFVAIDCDDVPLPTALDTRHNPQAVAAFVRGLLPDEFQRARLAVWFSSSAGMKSAVVSCRLFAVLDRAVTDGALKAWLRAMALPWIDIQASSGTVAIVYTARPEFRDGLRDPLPGARRLVVLEGDPCVIVPASVPTPEQERVAAREARRIESERSAAALARRSAAPSTGLSVHPIAEVVDEWNHTNAADLPRLAQRLGLSLLQHDASWRGPCPRCSGETRCRLYVSVPGGVPYLTCSNRSQCGLHGWAVGELARREGVHVRQFAARECGRPALTPTPGIHSEVEAILTAVDSEPTARDVIAACSAAGLQRRAAGLSASSAGAFGYVCVAASGVRYMAMWRDRSWLDASYASAARAQLADRLLRTVAQHPPARYYLLKLGRLAGMGDLRPDSRSTLRVGFDNAGAAAQGQLRSLSRLLDRAGLGRLRWIVTRSLALSTAPHDDEPARAVVVVGLLLDDDQHNRASHSLARAGVALIECTTSAEWAQALAAAAMTVPSWAADATALQVHADDLQGLRRTSAAKALRLPRRDQSTAEAAALDLDRVDAVPLTAEGARIVSGMARAAIRSRNRSSQGQAVPFRTVRNGLLDVDTGEARVLERLVHAHELLQSGTGPWTARATE